jgi:hypothetical protein
MNLTRLLFAAAFLLSAAAFAQTPSYAWYDTPGENNGLSEDKPFLIANANEFTGLANIANGTDERTRDYFSGKFVKLTSDIMLQENASEQREWIAIYDFRGTLDGAGFVVSGAYVNNTDASQGLFRGISGTVKNLGVIDSYIRGGYYVGVLSGNNGGTIENCYATGNAYGISSVGGLIGENGGTIENSYATGNVEGSSNIGGLVGANHYGRIKNSYATGSVKGSNAIGGLVGLNGGTNDEGIIENSYAAGNVEGSSAVGGLVGAQRYGSRIEKSYATGNTSGRWNTGGLVGNNDGKIKNCYATGNVEGTRYLGGLIGDNTTDGIIENCYAAVSIIEKISEDLPSGYFGGLTGRNLFEIINSYFDSDLYTHELNGVGFPKSSIEMKNKETYENWDFNDIWIIDENESYPYLTALPVPPPPPPRSSSSFSSSSDNSSSSSDSGTPELSSSSDTDVIQSSSSSDGASPVIISRIASGQTIIQATSNAILLENLPQNAKVQIYNLQGRRIYSNNNHENPLILKIMVQTKGLYFIKINNAITRVVVR